MIGGAAVCGESPVRSFRSGSGFRYGSVGRTAVRLLRRVTGLRGAAAWGCDTFVVSAAERSCCSAADVLVLSTFW